MTTRATLYRLIEELPESELPAADRYLAYLRATSDQLDRKLAGAPEDDEPVTPEDEAAIAEGWAAYRRGDVVSDEDLRGELGL